MSEDTIKCRVTPGRTYSAIARDESGEPVRVKAKEGDVVNVSPTAFARSAGALLNLDDASAAVDVDPTPEPEVKPEGELDPDTTGEGEGEGTEGEGEGSEDKDEDDGEGEA